MFHHPLKILKNNKPALNYILIASILGPFVGISLSFYSINNTQVGIASTLMATTPIMMLPLAKRFLGERIGWKSILGAIISFVGVSCLFIK